MRRTEKQTTNRKKLLHRLIAIAIMAAIVVAALSLTVFAQNSYLITDGDYVTVHRSYSTDPEVVLDEAGIELSEEDTYTTTYRNGVSRIDVQRMQMVTVINAGEQSVIGTYGETAKTLLSRMGIVPGTGDILSCEDDTPTYDGMVIELKHKEIRQTEYDKSLPYDTKYYEDPELAPGEEITLIEGVDGVIHYTAQLVYENGELVSEEVIDEEATTKMVTRLVVRGPERAIDDQPTAPDHRNATIEDPMNNDEHAIGGGTITTVSGTSYRYSDVLTVTCTAYSCGDRVGTTATGTVARVGAVAVDPRYIPLGTKMYIVSNDGQYIYGYCTAEDTGGSIKGYKIDLYFDTFDECWEFGVRTCTVYILS
ncbi:MAG: G5 domain-containing protein [Oscillospiraceae bacterium]|nr:G5 domain-containing protein [Oscillospiraceae bacterium]